MTALESMIKKLSPLNLYEITQDSNIYAELSAYASALDAHRDNIDVVLRECFISSSESFGIENREKVIGSLKSNYTTEQRRQMLILRKIIDNDDFTLSSFESFLQSIGVYDYIITQMPERYELNIQIGGSYSTEDEVWIINQINLAFPAHLEVSVNFGGLEWSEIDGKDLTFSAMDDYDYSWSTINNLQ